MMSVVWLFGCSEVNIGGQKVEPADPPGQDETPVGDPPDWLNCFEGWRGFYSNLTIFDDFVDPGPLEDPAPVTPDGFDYWSEVSFEDYEPTLDFGQNWWPVDEDIEGDPKYFAAHWIAWIRTEGAGDVEFSLGSQDDAWVYIDGQLAIANPGIHDFERQNYSVFVDGGQFPIEVWFAHRGSENSGFSLRLLSEDVLLCYPDFGTGETAP